MNLLPQNRLIRTSRVDHADWNYKPLLSYAMRRRFALILSLLPRARVPRILEVGFGSGVFMPELAAHCESLYGVDVHSNVPDVQTRLAEEGITVHLVREDAAHTSFGDGFFDLIVAVSTLEFIDDVNGAVREFSRLLRPGGRLLAVMPSKSALLDLALRLATGESAQRDYGNRREVVIPAVLHHFGLRRQKHYMHVYTAYEFERRDDALRPNAVG